MARIEDEEETKGPPIGEEADTPDEISLFLTTNAIGEKYQMVLKELPGGGGKPQYIKSYSNWHPTIDDIGEQWGPGEYEITFSWKTAGMSGRKEPVAKSFRVALPEKAWRDVHDRWLEKRAEEKRNHERDKLTAEVERARAYGQAGMAPQQNASELDALKKAMETLKMLGVPIGGPPQAPQKDWASILTGLAPVIAAAAPVVAAFVGKKREDTNGPLLQLLITKMLDTKPQGESETMKTVVPFLMGTMKQLFEMKEAMKPEEKEPFIERVFEKLTGSLPMLMEFAKMSKGQRESNMMYNMAKNHPDVQAIMGDIELQIAFVNKLDAFYGFQQTNQILEVMGVPRPKATEGNAKVYPSKGHEAAEDVQEDLRSAPGASDNGGEGEPANPME